MRSALVVGCGYSGMRLAGRLLELGYGVVGTTRDESRAAELRGAGIETFVGDLADRESLRRVVRQDLELVVYLVPPQREAIDPLEGVLAAVGGARLQAFLYASSTAVYGDRGGDWVDEMTSVNPSGAAALRHRAEVRVVGSVGSENIPARVCRITGIYGPGRTLRRALESGDYVLIREYDTWVNRIHVDDLTSGLIAAWQRGVNGEVYNFVDDEPHRASEFAFMAADLHGLSRPDWVGIDEATERLGEQRLRRKLDDKRVRNRRLREDLGVHLRYPTFREGLPAAVAEEREGE